MSRGAALCSVFVAFASFAIASQGFAQAPSTLSYQGVLTDASGTILPDGPYNISFAIYNVPSLGSALYTENQFNVPLTKGGFSVIIGPSPTLVSLAFTSQLYLGISVNGGPQLSPRVQLTSAPYALGLRLPFSATQSSSSPLLSLRNSGAGVDLLAERGVYVGSPTSTGLLNWWQNGSANPIGQLGNVGFRGGSLSLYDEAGNPTVLLEPDDDGGAGGFFAVRSKTSGFNGVRVEGNWLNRGGPYTVMAGDQSQASFDMTVTGDQSIVLPTNSISSPEVLDEPGIAQGRVHGFDITNSNSSSLQDIMTVTITTPAAGYIIVSSSGQIALNGGAGGSSAELHAQIDETAGGSMTSGYETTVGFVIAPAGYSHFSLHVQRVYYKATAGPYTFRLEGFKDATVGLQAIAYSSSLTAMYVPTSYGTVTAAPGGIETNAAETDPLRRTTDLRELELRVLRERLEAERAAREFAEARAQKSEAPSSRTAQ